MPSLTQLCAWQQLCNMATPVVSKKSWKQWSSNLYCVDPACHYQWGWIKKCVCTYACNVTLNKLSPPQKINIIEDTLVKYALYWGAPNIITKWSLYPLEMAQVLVEGTITSTLIREAVNKLWNKSWTHYIPRKKLDSSFDFDIIYLDGCSCSMYSYLMMFKL